MARLPQYTQQVTRKATAAPQVTTENNMGEAIGKFAQGTASLLNVQAQMQQREARDYVIASQNKTSVGLAQERSNLSRTAVTGSEYTEGVTSYIEKQKEAALENSPTPKAAEATGKYYDALMAKELENAIPVAANMNAINTAEVQRESLQLGFNATLQDPNEYESSLENGALIIQSSDLPENKKETAIKQFDNELSYYRFKGQIKKDPSRALSELNSGEWNSRLKPAQLELLTREAANQVKSVKASNTKKLSGEISDYIAYKTAGGSKVTEYDETSLKAVYGNDEGAEIYKKIKSANEFASDYNKVELAGPDELAALYESQAVTGPEGFRVEAPQQQAMAGAIQKRNKDLVKDSGLYALKSPNVKTAFDNYQVTGDGKEFAQVTISEQERLGVPAGYETIMPKQQAAAMVKQYQEGGEDASIFVSQLQDQFGDYYPKVLQELTAAGLSPNASVVAILPAGGRAGSLLAQADKEGYGVIKDNISEDDHKVILDDVESELADFYTSTYSEGTKSQIRGATELLAMKYLSSGVYPSAGESVEAAANDIINSRYSFTDEYRIPIEHNEIRIENGVETAIESLQNIDLMPPASNLPDNIAQQVYKVRMKAKAQTMNDDSGVVMVDFQNQPILTADGNMIRFTWDELSTGDLSWFEKLRGGQ